MTKQLREKQERIIEAVRSGLEGPAAVEFVRQSGYAMNQQGIARNLKKMGGRKRVEDLIAAGHSNIEVLQLCIPDVEADELPKPDEPSQGDLFGAAPGPVRSTHLDPDHSPLYEMTRITLKVPADLYEAIRLAARAEEKSQNQLIVDILTSALSRMPEPPWEEEP